MIQQTNNEQCARNQTGESCVFGLRLNDGCEHLGGLFKPGPSEYHVSYMLPTGFPIVNQGWAASLLIAACLWHSSRLYATNCADTSTFRNPAWLFKTPQRLQSSHASTTNNKLKTVRGQSQRERNCARCHLLHHTILRGPNWGLFLYQRVPH